MGSLLRRVTLSCIALTSWGLLGCTEVTPDGVGNTPGVACVPTGEVETSCGDGVDNDCNGVTDCNDSACFTDDACTIPAECGQATLTGDTLAIPDGVGQAYETDIAIDGFVAGQTLDNANGFVSVCVEMEHSWLRDLQIELECPSGQVVVLNEFLGQTGNEVFMGTPNDDDYYDPTPGTGMNYCWTESASNSPMLDWATSNAPSDPFAVLTLPPGDYQPSESFAGLVGCSLNGPWTIRAIDDWADDNGYIFGWTINFSPDIIEDCSGWVE